MPPRLPQAEDAWLNRPGFQIAIEGLPPRRQHTDTVGDVEWRWRRLNESSERPERVGIFEEVHFCGLVTNERLGADIYRTPDRENA